MAIQTSTIIDSSNNFIKSFEFFGPQWGRYCCWSSGREEKQSDFASPTRPIEYTLDGRLLVEGSAISCEVRLIPSHHVTT
jgi:hypothetical protein